MLDTKIKKDAYFCLSLSFLRRDDVQISPPILALSGKPRIRPLARSEKKLRVRT